MKTPAITATLKGAIQRNGYSGVKLAKKVGLPYQTLIYRYKHPATWRFCEFGALLRNIEFTDDELKIIGKEVKEL